MQYRQISEIWPVFVKSFGNVQVDLETWNFNSRQPSALTSSKAHENIPLPFATAKLERQSANVGQRASYHPIFDFHLHGPKPIEGT